MPGIFGFYNVTPRTDAAKLSERMLARLRTVKCPTSSQYLDPLGRYALGRVSLGVLPTTSQPVSLREGRIQAVMDGELDDVDAGCDKPELQSGRVDHNEPVLAMLLNYINGGTQAVSQLDGSFAAAIVDLSGKTLTLISDRFGTRPIYYARANGRFCFASSISALLADSEIPRDPDWKGISQFFTFGHYFNNDTSLDAVKILPAGSVLIFDAGSNHVSLQRYWRGAERIGPRPNTRGEAFEAIDEALMQSVKKKQACSGNRLGISLSGGLDARTILGTLDRSRLDLTTVCMGMRGSQDHKASTALARIVGCPHHNHILDTTFLSEFGRHLVDMVRLTDGQYLSQCIIMPTLPVYQQLGVRVLLRGHGGELMHMSKAYNFSLDSEALQLRSESALENWLWKRLPAFLQEGVEGPLFVNRELHGQQVARESLREALAETPQSESPVQRVVHLFLDQRVRRETMLSMMKFRSVVEPRLPYLDRLLVERLLAVPIEWKLDDEIQTHILRKHQPRFCDIENTNTGAPLGAGSLRRSYARLKLRVFGKLGVPGYQPYERLGSWLRRDLADLVQNILLSKSCLDRGIFSPNTVRQIVHRHIAGQRNHTYLIMALLIFEIGQRWLLDEKPLQDDRLSQLATAV
jgi:asparagine synthase (glutamine-hydrolysing)